MSKLVVSEFVTLDGMMEAPGMARDLVDEYRTMIFPVILGSGRRLFPETPHKTMLRLAGTRVFDSGVVEHVDVPVDR